LKSLGFFAILFRPVAATKQFPRRRNHFELLAQNSGNAAWLSTLQQQRRTAPAAETGDRQMRTLSFILAFAFVLVGPSIAGSLESSLPGIGTFAYSGSAIVTTAPPAIVVAAR
jgi:hypothetical protein